MKILILALLLSNVANAQIQKDKVLHFGAGVLIGGITSLIIKKTELKDNKFACILVSTTTSTLIAVGKEAYDQYVKKTFADDRDILWTAIGGLVGGVSITYTIKYRKKPAINRVL